MGILSIIVLNYNRLKYTKQTISSLIKNTSIKHEFIFVDNGSTDGTREYLKSLKNKTNASREILVFNKYNYGVAGGRSSGLIHARGDYLMTIDDDVLVPSGYDKHIASVCDNVKKIGVTGINVEKRKYPIVKINGVDVQLKKDNLGGACLCLPRRVFGRVGYFSPDFVYGGEDLDLYFRVKELGLISAYIVPNGKHIDRRENKDYELLKKQAHQQDSEQVKKAISNAIEYRKRGSVFVPYRIPDRFD
jgi:GT2 family glycosyltransferase